MITSKTGTFPKPTHIPPSIGDYGNVTLGGSLRKTISFADIENSRYELEAQHDTPGAFKNFQEQFSIFFDSLLHRQDSGFPLEQLPMDPISVKQDENVCFMLAVFLHHSASADLTSRS